MYGSHEVLNSCLHQPNFVAGVLHITISLSTDIVRPATNGDDFAGNSIVLEFTPSNAGQQHCLTIPIIEDTVYEGEEIFGFEIYKDEALEVSVPKPRVVVRITDNDGMFINSYGATVLSGLAYIHVWPKPYRFALVI